MAGLNSNDVGPREPVRKSFLLVIVLVGLVAVGGAIAFFAKRGPAAKSPTESAEATPAGHLPPKRVRSSGDAAPAQPTPLPPESVSANPAAVAPPAAPQPPLSPAPPRPEPSPYTRQLVNSLTQLDWARGPLTAEQAAEWKNSLQQLVQQGAAAVPAIREFLERNQDVAFDPAGNGQLLGQSTLRLAMLDALQAIGGPEALELALQTLPTATQPREIAQLARMLEQQAPEQHREAILQAARQALANASAGKLAGADMGPVFGVLQQYGGGAAVDDLQKAAGQWRYYSAISLADLPDGAGVPALLQMLQGNRGSQSAAIQALAQVASQYPEAGAALLEQARLNKVPGALWPTLGALLAGDKLFIGDPVAEGKPPASGDRAWHAGNQNFYSTRNPTPLPTDQVQQRIALIDQLLGASADPIAQNSLKQARERLTAQPGP